MNKTCSVTAMPMANMLREKYEPPGMFRLNFAQPSGRYSLDLSKPSDRCILRFLYQWAKYFDAENSVLGDSTLNGIPCSAFPLQDHTVPDGRKFLGRRSAPGPHGSGRQEVLG